MPRSIVLAALMITVLFAAVTRSQTSAAADSPAYVLDLARQASAKGSANEWGEAAALWEEAVYDDNGQLLTGSLADYAIPRADRLPDIEVLSTVTPSPHHPLGVKGIGEAGTIASTCTVYNAVIDALQPLGVDAIQMPLTPERVWRAITSSAGHKKKA